MDRYLIPLLLGFVINWASAFTSFFTRRWGERAGRLISALLRNVFGIPVWLVGLALAMRTPSPLLLMTGATNDFLGWVLMLSGAIVITLSLLSIGRRAAAPSVHDTLTTSGVYAYVRHPIYSAMFLEFAGLFIMIPTRPMLITGLTGVVWALVQARLEEIDLLQRLPGYLDYMERIPRFFPRFRKRYVEKA